MHRQSLGSPSSKLHLHGSPKEAPLSPQEPKRRPEVVDDDNNKTHRLSLSPSPAPNKFIHLIPILTLICFFILYLFSHSPSQSDLAQFNGFKRSSNHFDSAVEMNDIQKHIRRNEATFWRFEACVICERLGSSLRNQDLTGNSLISNTD